MWKAFLGVTNPSGRLLCLWWWGIGFIRSPGGFGCCRRYLNLLPPSSRISPPATRPPARPPAVAERRKLFFSVRPHSVRSGVAKNGFPVAKWPPHLGQAGKEARQATEDAVATAVRGRPAKSPLLQPWDLLCFLGERFRSCMDTRPLRGCTFAL